MSTYLPTVILTDEIIEALQVGTLTLNRGQWVTYQSLTGAGGGKGRLISVSENGVRILWRMVHESFRSFCRRFKRAVTKPARKPRYKFIQLALELVDRVKNVWLRRALDLKRSMEQAKKTGWAVYRQLCDAIEQLSDEGSPMVRSAGRMGFGYCWRECRKAGVVR
ncbi:hypothetical protein [Thiohalomonas denitrificans]|uniref:Uncharacterized protein n=1 Tax=Thiohalomonas denitrificans TaxID=415747 RepID=A0A1G5PTY1_9GAMM|nr:hypothetical protein [Thiohalomonas denitrificans]SCZ52993.1 hypothetical protein SAMN03097708_00846 [Thiohalomonas denitrificans]